MQNNLIKTIDKIYDKHKSEIDKSIERSLKIDKFLNMACNLHRDGAVYFQLDNRIINAFNQEASILKAPIVKIINKNREIVTYIDLYKWEIGVADADNILSLSGLIKIN